MSELPISVVAWNGTVHPAADLLPLASPDEIAALGESIRVDGQRHPILLDEDGTLVDGRGRLRACELVGVEPIFATTNGDDPVAVSIRENVRGRKLLTSSQRAIAAAECWPLVGGKPERGGDRANGGERRLTFAELARRWETSETMLKQATALVERDPDAAAAVKGGESLNDAYDALLARERERTSASASLARLREQHPDLAELVDAESLSLREALAAGKERDDQAAEERRTRTGVLVALVSAPPTHHAARYAEVYDSKADPAGTVTAESLRRTAAFASAVANALEEGTA